MRKGKLANAVAPTFIVEGAVRLAVEVIAPKDTVGHTDAQIDAYLAANCSAVWVIDPHRRTVTVYRPDAEPALYSGSDELSAEPHLSGFRVAVAALFE